MNKILTALTGENIVDRGANKVSSAIDVVDKTLGLETRETIKGVFENGIKGTILNGIRKDSKNKRLLK